MKKFSILLILLIGALNCKKVSNETETTPVSSHFQYLEKLSWMESSDSLVIFSSGNRFSIAQKELPLQSAMVIPTSGIAYLSELNLSDKITGISQPDFIYNPEIQELIRKNKIIEIAGFDEIFVESVLMQKPDVLISTSSPNLAKYHALLKKEGVKILLIDEYEESSPLARAEYLKIIGKLFGKEKESLALFHEIEKNYKEIQEKVQNQPNKAPTVLSNQIYGDVWYLAGGKSYQANLIRDAGGKYLWDADENTGSLHLSFESVFEKAHDADVWVNAGDFSNKSALLASYPNYEWFKAFKTGNIYNWNKRKSAAGANDFFETGTVRPDWVLKDLAAIFHPELFPGHELYFYEKLE